MSEIKDYPPYLDYPKPRRNQTNADRVRSMTDEELAITFAVNCAGRKCPHNADAVGDECMVCWLEWLKKEASE